MNKEAFIAGFTKAAESFHTNDLPQKYESEITPELASLMDEYLRRYEILSPQTNRVRQILPYGIKANTQNPLMLYRPNETTGGSLIMSVGTQRPYIRHRDPNNTPIGNAIKAHELGHQIDFDLRPEWLLNLDPDFIGPPPPKPNILERERDASVLARAIKGKDYTEEDHTALANFLSSYYKLGLPPAKPGETPSYIRALPILTRKQLDEGWNTYTNIHPQTNYWQVDAQAANNFKNFKLSIPSTNDWQGPIAPPSVPTGGARPVSTDLNKQIPTPSPSYPTPKSPSIFDRLKGMIPERYPDVVGKLKGAISGPSVPIFDRLKGMIPERYLDVVGKLKGAISGPSVPIVPQSYTNYTNSIPPTNFRQPTNTFNERFHASPAAENTPPSTNKPFYPPPPTDYAPAKSPSIFDRLKGMMPKRQANTTPNNIK